MTEQPPAPVPVRWQAARIVSMVRRTPTVASFFVEPAMPFVHLAGQHVDIRLTAPDGYTAQRSYSIASAPSAGGPLELAIERLPDGEVSPYFHDVATPGDEIEIKGPLGGHFVWEPGDGRPVLLVGGGSGVVPLVAMLREHAAAPSTAPMSLLYSARTPADILYRDELAMIAAARPAVTILLTLTRHTLPAAGVGHNRRIDEAMVADAVGRLGSLPQHVFVCGSNAFVSAASDALIAAGIGFGAIHTERYGQ